MQSTLANKNAAVFELKGSLVTLTVLYLLSADTKSFAQQLAQHVAKTPNLFKNMPLIIDLQKVSQVKENVDLRYVSEQLQAFGIVPVGVRNGSPHQQAVAQAAGLPILPSAAESSDKKPKPTATNTSTASATTPNKIQGSLLIKKPVRSGQRIYAKDANLIILAPVNHGAELIADGHIHVYSTLQGRVLAGVSGDTSVRIFCQKLQAELISIAGYYKLQDDIHAPEDAHTTQIFLENGQLRIEGIL